MTNKVIRKTKLKTMQRKQRIEKRLVQSWSRVKRHTKFYERLPVVKNFEFKERTQDWNPKFGHALDTTEKRTYVPEKIQSFCEYLKDLFCIDHKILLDIRYNKSNSSGRCCGAMFDGYQRIMVGASGGLRASTVIHEFLHASEFNHEYEINEYSDFRSTCTLDTYSPLIVKDIFGKKEVLLI